MYKHIFDLDNTLVFTDKLNSEAYNYALEFLGKAHVLDVDRITRNVVFSKFDLTDTEKKTLVEIKQQYFLDNIEKIQKNDKLLSLLLNKNPTSCVLWTSAEKCRVEAILNYLKLTNAFSLVFYSKKTDIKDDLENICKYFQCSKSQLKFYEDDSNVINELKILGINNIWSKLWVNER